MISNSGPDPEHVEILAGLRAGHPAAFRIVEGWLRGTIVLPQFSVPRDDVDDLVQEALAQIIVIVREPDFRISISLKALVRRIAMARSVDHARRRRITCEVSPDLAGSFSDPLECLAQKEDLRRVHVALTRLKALCRDLIQWHFYEEKEYATIAAKTGRNAGTLRVHMFKCLQDLRKSLAL